MSQNMKNRYRVFRRGWGTYYCEDLRTGKQEEMHRHTQPQLALGQEPRWQGRDVDPAAATTTRVLRAHRPAHHHLGRHVVEFFAGFLADTLRGLSAVGARIERFGLHDEGLTFQVFGQRVAAPTSSSFGRVSQLLRWLVLQDIVAGGRVTLEVLLEVGGDFGELAFLLRGELLGLLAEELAFEFGQLEQRLLQLRLQTLIEREQARLLFLQRAVVSPQLRQLRLGSLHPINSCRKWRRSG